jgi:hypothetical protein
MPEWILTDEEAFLIAKKGITVGEYSLERWILGRYEVIAKAQAHKMVEMIENKWGDVSGVEITMGDWQQLRKEVGL